MNVLAKLKKEWFLVGMVVAIALATVTSELGRSGGVIHLDQLTGIGIAIVFFLHGLGLSPQAIKAGLTNWRLHVYIQMATFVVYPILWVIFGEAFLAYMPSALAFGFCYLLVLPSTISSSVAMTSVGKGNVPGAIFNASLSSILGVFITPLLIQLFMGFEGVQLDLLDSVISISKLLLLPMIAGQIMRPYLVAWVDRHKAVVNKVDKYVILLIVYNAFCDSVVNGIWSEFSVGLLATSIIICTVILLVMVHLIQWGARRTKFTLPDEVAAVFCGTKKTLAAGIPMAKVIFGADPSLGMILLPIMLYHPIQIFYCAVLANRYARQSESLKTVTN
ncbi:bile acid:sodium symporter family protein [Vibrio fluvialis]|jgi:sodium/bile acid cotransporter 7|uniref:bile acid:sodium symporter family protein n=2 Tax=Vibrio fluvialis TaxID=676 RepID=UPI0005CACA43|nr:bile acid:sodium symporter family protein [Vibrio fluvialis]EKO3536351.1 bile acid:sodium symporter [Vibrio fluvialis]EKO3904940.1 bile acid:sodium symporter [Vibrio fluvialis]EKO3933060.1 bile acid:sodium symporter [Vibrio fluvialis]EKO3963933.1 bile acid:sodium symporter [Vibrio fluvialis]EKO3991825.1 bile acid:sodium symporter [Vibrio fluvialis]